MKERVIRSFFCKNWKQLFTKFLDIDPSGRISGVLFEDFAKLCFENEPTVAREYKNIWLFKESPLSIKDILGLGTIDRGIDLILDYLGGFITNKRRNFFSNGKKLLFLDFRRYYLSQTYFTGGS